MTIDVRCFPAVRDLDGLDVGSTMGARAFSADAIQETPEDVPEPISLQQAKDHLRVVINDEDDYIAGLIVAARQMAEGRLNRSLVRQTRRVAFDRNESYFRLPRPPLISITSVASAGDELDESTYRLDDVSTPARLIPLRGWPTLTGAGDVVLVEYEAGYDEGQVPRPIVQWMLLVIGSLYDNRETMSPGAEIYSIPEEFVSWLLQPYMVYE